jgi:hypothetical protein
MSQGPSTRTTRVATQSSTVLKEGMPLRQGYVSNAAFKIARFEVLNLRCIAQHISINLKYKKLIGGRKIGMCLKGEHKISNLERSKPHI